MKTLVLNSSNWTLCNTGTRQELKDIQMNVPGDNFSALIRAGKISDPFVAMNEKDCQWVGREDWVIERSFDFCAGEGMKHYLCLDRVDTFFKAYVNGLLVGEGHNYFRSWRFDVTQALKPGKNVLRIEFLSAENQALERAKALPYAIPFSVYDMYSPHRNLVRKIQCQGGWDWGPCLMVSGVYGDVYLDSVKEGYIASVCTETLPLEAGNYDGSWTVKVKVRYEALQAGKKVFLIELTGNGKSLVKSSRQDLALGMNEFEVEMTLDEAVVWKTADELKEEGLLENSLYNLKVCCSCDYEGAWADFDKAFDSGNDEFLDAASRKFAQKTGRVEDSVMEKKIGVRELKAVSEEDEAGCSLYFRLNGRGIFAKGANWIPCDALPENWTQEKYRYLLESCVRANMNVVRVWGGGQYEKDEFYDLCDSLGIIVWMDCMFACSLYPTDQEFLDDVRLELEDNVYRLQSHASIGLWCGNNENYGAINWYEESRNARDRYLVDYDRLNHGVVEKTVKACDPTRTFWPSSPCAGLNRFGDNWHSDGAGDMHFWSVWHEKKDFEHYLSIRPRFVSEFGYESFPSLETVKTFAKEEDFNLTSPVMEWHQRSPSGNSIILENFSRYFRIPVGFENMLYLSQVQQALAIKTAIDYWRSLRPRCMGAIFWQLNDVWPAVSWSSLEHSGKWKLLHYQAKRFFEPLSFSLYKKEGKVYASVVNDTRSCVEAKVKIQFMDFEGRVLKEIEAGQSLEPDCASVLWESSELMENPEGWFVYGTMSCVVQGKAVLQDDVLFVERWKKCSLEKPEIEFDVRQCEDGVEIELKSKKPAFYVQLELPGKRVEFSRNMFTLIPGQSLKVFVEARNWGKKEESSLPSLQEIKEGLKVTSLRDTY